jgi:hypothetical protein
MRFVIELYGYRSVKVVIVAEVLIEYIKAKAQQWMKIA